MHVFSGAEAGNVVIDEVWAIDFVQHGDSAMINQDVIGDVCGYRSYFIVAEILTRSGS